MPQIAVSRLKDRLSEFLAVAEAGSEVIVTRHGREVARIMPPVVDKQALRRSAVAKARDFSEMYRRKYGTVSTAEILAWIEEDRR